MKDREGEESRAAFIKNLKIERLMDKRHFTNVMECIMHLTLMEIIRMNLVVCKSSNTTMCSVKSKHL